MGILLPVVGRILAWLPVSLVALFCWLAGGLIYYAPTKRRRTVLSNLHHCFPAMAERERRRMALRSARLMVETGLFVLASPYMSQARLRTRFQLDPELLRLLEIAVRDRLSYVLLVPHFALMEAITLFPALYDGKTPDTGVIYRPFDQPAVERWVRATRQRFGLRLLSRKQGFFEAMEILRKGGCVAVLFDQNAGTRGLLTLLFGRVCSTTELPGLLAEKYQVPVAAIFPRRSGFWRATIEGEILDLAPGPDAESIPFSHRTALAANRWLENKLTDDAHLRGAWLWLHDRWRHQDAPALRLRLVSKRNILEEDLRFNGLTTLPRKTRFWVRMPNWLGDAVMVLPLLRAMREARPDAEFTLLAPGSLAPWLERLAVADRVIALPSKKKSGYWRFFHRLRGEYPDAQWLFTHSFRGDLEARLIGAPQRFGLVLPGRRRPLLSHPWILPEGIDTSQVHQTLLWERFLANFGLQVPLRREPYRQAPFPWTPSAREDWIHLVGTPRIGLVCGTENSPEKRWPVERWRELITQLLGYYATADIVLFGTRRDAEITAMVAGGFPAGRIHDRAGKTDLLTFADGVASCSLLIGNDTGGMHLANAIGVPTVVVFGPTNPVRTGPVFNTPHRIIQPQGAGATGGEAIAGVSATMVFSTAVALLENPTPVT